MALASGIIGIHGGCFDAAGVPFKIVGANNYYLAFATPGMRGAVLEAAKEIGLNVLRAPAYLDCGFADPGCAPVGAWRGTYFQYWNPNTNAPEVNTGENGLQRLDQLIADAERVGIRLILPLVNHWPDFGGMDQYVRWFNRGSRDEFYRDPNIRAAYKAYVQQILTRTNTVTGRPYAEEPAILAWELANEPRCQAEDGRQMLLTWIYEMSHWIKQHDPNHLLAVGDEGFFSNGRGDLYDGTHGVDCDAFLQAPDIDFGTFHLYPQAWKQAPLQFGLRWIEEHLAAGRRAAKPMLLEEYGLTVDGKAVPSSIARNAIYAEWLESIFVQQGAGDLAWMIAALDDNTGEPYPDYDHFTFYSAADVPALREHAIQMISAL